MRASEHTADPREFFPFNCCDASVCGRALTLGKTVIYEAGETVLYSGSPAKHCGLIVAGEAVAFKTDSSGRRYQLCLGPGCFIGLETLRQNDSYSAKITALSELEVLFWNRDGIARLTEQYPDFAGALEMLDDGRIYQEQWLIPETDVTDPVLCSLPAHWLSTGAPVFWIIPLLLTGLAACAILIRRFALAWLLAFMLLGAAGVLLYRQISARSNRRLIVTSRNAIFVPQNSEEDVTVLRFSALQSLRVLQNLPERLLNIGRICFETESQKYTGFLLRGPVSAASLIRSFAERTSQGREIPMTVGNEAPRKIPLKDTAEDRPAVETPVRKPERDDGLPPLLPFQRTEIHAHWALLVRMLFKPVMVLLVSAYAIRYFRYSPNVDSIRKILILIIAAAAAAAVFQIQTWRNHRFTIEEDCVKDYSRRPFSRENRNMAMNSKIQSVHYEKEGFFQSLLNYGTVYILAGEGELSFDYVSDPARVQQQIIDACSRIDEKRQIEEEARRRAYITCLVSEIRSEQSGD